MFADLSPEDFEPVWLTIAGPRRPEAVPVSTLGPWFPTAGRRSPNPEISFPISRRSPVRRGNKPQVLKSRGRYVGLGNIDAAQPQAQPSDATGSSL